jgi:A/G-specific adenine glycosylase
LADFRRRLRRWYLRNRRHLPWRESTDPYRIWLSEIMLQQTQVNTVVGYYRAFLKRFGSIERLADASLRDVLRAWQGLGYYRRAIDLHRAAREMMRTHGGQFPRDTAEMTRLAGIGRYTAAAIASFAFGARAAILEANTRRLWTRLLAADDPSNGDSSLWTAAEAVLPTRRVGDFNQALLDLGALICKPREPRCNVCPVRTFCRAYQLGDPARYPGRVRRTQPVKVERAAVVLWAGRRVLIRQRPPHGQWSRLWEFPVVERLPDEPWSAAVMRAVRTVTGLAVQPGPIRMTLRHQITRFRVTLVCYDAWLVDLESSSSHSKKGAAGRWVDPHHLERYPFSTPQRRIARSVQQSGPARPAQPG